MSEGFDKEAIIRLMQDLERRLAAEGVELLIQVLGGAVLLMHGLLDRSTEDIDALYESAEAVERVAREMARDYNLPENWLNARAKMFLPDEIGWIALEGGSSAIRLVDLPSLAAMKLAAERQKDIEDLARISAAQGIKDPQELVDNAYKRYGECSMVLSASRENYEIVASEAIYVAQQLRERGEI